MSETFRRRLLLKSPPVELSFSLDSLSRKATLFLQIDQDDEDLRLLDVITSLTSQSKRSISSHEDQSPQISTSLVSNTSR
ncbi:hypothetical protein DY000_02058432 [Brassica cretica]|uniref:Uncharacterized protein n=1 Tax=Brassica cretica TaxID=69181 RepID=A0ABQ7B2H8_BRACR|nr:hypothetical protein DY000_02058432 [Brassica cretica]